MLRQKPGSYDPEKDSPLIGGHNNSDLVHTRVIWPEGEGAHGVKTSDLITLLEQAAEEFPKLRDRYPNPGKAYDQDEIDAWKHKWLTVPPVCG